MFPILLFICDLSRPPSPSNSLFYVQTEGPTSEFVKSTVTVGVEALKPGESYTVEDAIDQIGENCHGLRDSMMCLYPLV